MLTIVVVTRNRASFVRRLLGFLEGQTFGGRVVLADSSDPDQFAKTARAVEDHAVPGIVHRACPGGWSNFRCLAEVLPTVETPYVAWNADDDFLIARTLERAVRFLEEHPDYAVAHGEAVTFSVRADGAHGEVTAVGRYGQTAVKQPSAAGRLLAHLGAYAPTAYSVHRTPHLAESYARVVEYEFDGFFGELFASCLPLAYGKAVKLDGLYMARQVHGAMTSRQGSLDMFDRIAGRNWAPQCSHFLDCLGDAVARTDGLTIAAGRDVVKQAFWLYLARSLTFRWRLRYDQRSAGGRLRRLARRLPLFREAEGALRAWLPGTGRRLSLPALRRRSSPHHADFSPVLQVVENGAPTYRRARVTTEVT